MDGLKVCRACLSKDPSIPLFTKFCDVENVNNSTFADAFMEFACITISENDGFPESICASCESQIASFMKFKRICRDSHEVLQQWSTIKNESLEVVDEALEERAEVTDEDSVEKLSDIEIDNGSLQEWSSIVIEDDSSDDVDEIFVEKIGERDEHSVKGSHASSQNWSRFKKEVEFPEVVDDVFVERAEEMGHSVKKWTSIKKEFEPCEATDDEFVEEAQETREHSVKEYSNIQKEHKLCEVHDEVIAESTYEHSVDAIPKGEARTAKIESFNRFRFACNICSKSYKLQTNFDKHKCIKPQLIFNDYSQRKSAENNIDASDKVQRSAENVALGYKCNICYRSFESKILLITHKEKHKDRPVCNICGKDYADKYILKTHLFTHLDQKPFACDYCDAQFRTQAAATVHQRRHTGESPFKCRYCERGFKQIASMQTHERSHTGEKPYECGLCSKRYNTNANLKIHMGSHNGERPYGCAYCKKRFTTKHNLKKHSIRIHDTK